MSGNINLDSGAVQQMLGGNTSITPKLQVLDVKKIVTGASGERYRLVLSDGVHYIQGMLATQASHLVTESNLQKFAVINLKEFVCNNISGKKICVVIQCDIMQQLNQGIGKPTNGLTSNSGNNNNNNNNYNQMRNNNQMNRPPAPQNNQSFGQRNQYNNNNNNNNNRGGGGYGGNKNPSRFGQNQSQCQVQPVSSLNPYQNNWKIKVRCTKKENMKHYHNQKGDGKLFGLDLLDKDGTEIRAVAFNEAADKFFPIFEDGKVYLISKGQVRLARKGFSHINNDYSITLNEDAEVIPVQDDGANIQTQKYKFISIENIEQMEAKTFVDVLGIVIDISPLTTTISQKGGGKEYKRRTIKIRDKTAAIDITLWNQDAEMYDDKTLAGNPCIALKGCKVSTFGGRSLSASGHIEPHLDRQEATSLIQWWKQTGGTAPTKDLTTGFAGGDVGGKNDARRTIGEVKEMKLGEENDNFNNNNNNDNKAQPDWFTCVATITHISRSSDREPWYKACPEENNASKVNDMGDGKWRCEKNGKVYNSYKPRYILRFCSTDFTGNIWMTAFNDAAEKILKISATEAEKVLTSGDVNKFDKIFTDATFKKYIFKCKANSDQWEDQSRVRYTVVNVKETDTKQESDILFEKINKIQSLKSQMNGNNNNNNNSNNNNMNY